MILFTLRLFRTEILNIGILNIPLNLWHGLLKIKEIKIMFSQNVL